LISRWFRCRDEKFERAEVRRGIDGGYPSSAGETDGLALQFEEGLIDSWMPYCQRQPHH
jgi:hypothetical protein